MTSQPSEPRPQRRVLEAQALRENLLRRKAQTRAREESVAAIEEVLAFWFGRPGEPDYGSMRERWFRRDDAFDAEIAARFGARVEAAAAGALDDWAASPRGTLALLILLDQFPRNMYRGQARAFAADAHARAIAGHAVDAGQDQALEPVERVFVYLPFEHAECMPDQDRAVALFQSLPPSPWRDQTVEFARRHRAAIHRFGRFPARNAALGRASTPEEIEVLKTNPLGF